MKNQDPSLVANTTRCFLGFLNILLARLLRNGLSLSFDDTETNYRLNLESLQQCRNAVDYLSRVVLEVTTKINVVDVVKLKSQVETLLKVFLDESKAIMDKERRISDVERENAALKRSLYIERKKRVAMNERRKEAYEMLVRQETGFLMDAIDIPSYRFGTVVAGYLTMVYLNTVLRIDYFSYILTRSKDNLYDSLFDAIMTDPLKSRLEFEEELTKKFVNPKNYVEIIALFKDNQVAYTSSYLQLVHFIYRELQVFAVQFENDRNDTTHQSHFLMTPMIQAARQNAWNLIHRILKEAYQNDRNAGFGVYGMNCADNFNWILHNYQPPNNTISRLMSLFAKLTAAKFTELQLSKGHTTEKDKIERITVTDVTEIEIRECLRELGFRVASTSFAAAMNQF